MGERKVVTIDLALAKKAAVILRSSAHLHVEGGEQGKSLAAQATATANVIETAIQDASTELDASDCEWASVMADERAHDLHWEDRPEEAAHYRARSRRFAVARDARRELAEAGGKGGAR